MKNKRAYKKIPGLITGIFYSQDSIVVRGARNVFLKNIFLALKDSSIANSYELQLVNSNVY